MPRPYVFACVAALAGAMLISQQAVAQQAVAEKPATKEAVKLTYDPPLEVGAKYEAEVEVKTDQTLTIAGMPLESHANTFLNTSETVAAKSSEGGWKYEGEFTQVQSDIELPGGMKVSFNSINPDQAEAAGPLEMIVDALKATAGAKWVSETDAEHQLTKMEYIDDPFAGVNEMLKGDTSPEAIKKNRQMELKRYPSKAVKPGDTWTRIEESDLGGGQTITLEKEYTYAGSEQRSGRTFDKVTVKVLTAEYAMDENSPSPAKVTESDLSVADSGGTYWYDREAKSFTEVSDKVQITGTLTLEANDQKLPGELDLTIASNVKTKIVAP